MIKRITAMLCTFACAFFMLAPVFSRKTSPCDVVASAQTYTDTAYTYGIYEMPLPVVSSALISRNGYVGEYNYILPVVVVCGRDAVAFYRTHDGATSLTDGAIGSFVADDQYHDIVFPVRTQDGLGQEGYVTAKCVGFLSANNELPYGYVPSYMTCSILPMVIEQVEYLSFDFYVYYEKPNSANLLGNGFSIRFPVNQYHNFIATSIAHTNQSAFFDMYDVLRVDNIVGWSYNSYSSIFDVGYDDGYDDGYDNGRDYGFESGREIGYDIGYDDGYALGVEKGGKYTFNSLISAVIDVPINAIRSVLNFEILGVDMATFFFSLFTLALVVTIVRLLI